MTDTPTADGRIEAANDGRTKPSKMRTVKYVALLGAIAAIPAITTDIYLPSLPAVAADLQTSDSAVQWTVSAMLVGGALGQLLNGPLTDKFGRKLPLLVGVALHVILSLLCAYATNVSVLIALRAIQGMCNAAAVVVATAVIRDRFDGAPAARMMSQLMLVIGVAPLFAPTIGGFIASIWDWRAVFLALALFGLVMMLVIGKFLPETHPQALRMRGGLGGVAKAYGTLFTDLRFLALALLPAVGLTIIFCYVVGSSFVFQNEFGLSEGQFSLLFAVNGLAMVISSQVNAMLVGRFAPEKLLAFGITCQLLCAAALFVLSTLGSPNFWVVCVLVWFLLGFHGFIGPNAQVLALSNYGHMIGTAVAVIGALMSGIAGAVSPLVGVFGSDTQAMSGVMMGSLIVAAGVLVYAVKSGATRPKVTELK